MKILLDNKTKQTYNGLMIDDVKKQNRKLKALNKRNYAKLRKLKKII
jgi:hypothetical protein